MFVVAQQCRMSPCLCATRLIQHSQNTILEYTRISRYYSRYNQRWSTLQKRSRVSCSSSSGEQGSRTTGGEEVKKLPPVKRITRGMLLVFV